jgi:hypothetical protein
MRNGDSRLHGLQGLHSWFIDVPYANTHGLTQYHRIPGYRITFSAGQTGYRHPLVDGILNNKTLELVDIPLVSIRMFLLYAGARSRMQYRYCNSVIP